MGTGYFRIIFNEGKILLASAINKEIDHVF